mgnify:CR=1 FL=1
MAEEQQMSEAENFYLDSTSRLRGLEGKYNLLRDRALIINNNMIDQYKKTSTETKAINDDIKEIKSDLFKIKEAMKHMLKEFELFARKDEVKFLEKYINLWNPMKFVTGEELAKALEKQKESKVKKDG